METLLSDDALRKELGERASRIVTQEYDWSRVAQRLEGIYKDTCAHQ
jgi:glycosyltransferase involved in cell wall biosynthesis